MDSAIDWALPASKVARQINASGTSDSPCFSYLKGCRLVCLSATTERTKLDPPEIPPGTILHLNPDGSIVVSAGGRSIVRITGYKVTFYTHETTDFAEFLRVFRIALPQPLSSIPYLENRDSSIWERGVSVWAEREIFGGDDNDATVFTAGGMEKPTDILPHSRPALTEPNLPYFATLFDDLGIAPSSNCLDVGCGDGWAMWDFAKLGMRVAGFDISPAGFTQIRESIPGIQVAELDYFEAGDYYERQDITFGFIFCRGLGIAQKIVDWTDPEWRAATGRLLGRLTRDGVAFWSQHTDRSGQLTADSFTNPTASTILGFFRDLGFMVLDIRSYGGHLLLQLVRDGFSPARAARFRRRQSARRQRVLLQLRAAPFTSDQDLVWSAFREVTAHISNLLAAPGIHDKQRLIIAGVDPMAALYETAARVLYVPVLAHWSRDGDSYVANQEVHAPGWLPDKLTDYPTAIIVADPALEEIARATAGSLTPPIPVLSAWSYPVASTDEDLGGSFLLSGDQDRNLQPVVQTLLQWPPKASGAVQSAFSNRLDEGTVDASGWLIAGSGRATRSPDGYRFTALGDETMYLERTVETPFRLTATLSRRSGGPNDCGIEVTGNITWRLTINESGVSLSQSDRSEPVAFAPVQTNSSIDCEVHSQGDSLRFLAQGQELHSTSYSSNKAKRIRIGVIEKSGADTEMGCHEVQFRLS